VRDDIHKRAPIDRCLKNYLRTCLRPSEFENFGTHKATQAAERLLKQLRPEFCTKLAALLEGQQLGHPLLGGDILAKAFPKTGLETKLAEMCAAKQFGAPFDLTSEINRACDAQLRAESLNCEAFLWEEAPRGCQRAMKRWRDGLKSVPWSSLIAQRISGCTFRAQGFTALA